jgi:hypothetical protein
VSVWCVCVGGGGGGNLTKERVSQDANSSMENHLDIPIKKLTVDTLGFVLPAELKQELASHLRHGELVHNLLSVSVEELEGVVGFACSDSVCDRVRVEGEV